MKGWDRWYTVGGWMSGRRTGVHLFMTRGCTRVRTVGGKWRVEGGEWRVESGEEMDGMAEGMMEKKSRGMERKGRREVVFGSVRMSVCAWSEDRRV